MFSFFSSLELQFYNSTNGILNSSFVAKLNGNEIEPKAEDVGRHNANDSYSFADASCPYKLPLL